MQKFKEGQKVEVIDRLNGHGFEIGEIVEIKYADPDANGGLGDYDCFNNEGRWYLTDDEIKLIENE